METIYPIITSMETKLPFYVTGVGCQENQDYINRPSGFMNYQWAYCKKGEGRLEIGEKKYTVPEKAGFFFSPGVPHKYYAVKEPWEVQWLIFDGYALPSLLEYLGFNKWEFAPSLNIEYMDRLIIEIASGLKAKKSNSAAECSELLYTFLIRIRTFISKKNDGKFFNKLTILKPVINFMEANLSSDISLSEMAEIINVTPSHLCRMFKKCYNMTAFQYLANIRIQKSKQLLTQYPEMEVKEISKKAGYNDPSYFCMIFKKMEGVTPGEFRGI